MRSAESFYSIPRLDQILSNWPAYESAAEHLRASAPLAFRPSKRLGDPMASADICADVGRAMVRTLAIGSPEWCVVDLRRHGWTFRDMADELGLPRATVYEQYMRALDKLSRFLGFVDDS